MRSILRWKRLTNDHSRSARSSSRRVPASIVLECLDRGLELMASGVGLGQRPRIGLVLARAIAVERQLVEEMGGRRCGVPLVGIIGVEEGEGAVVVRHSGCLSAGGSAAPSRPSRRSLAGRGRHRIAPCRAAAQRRMAGGRAFCFALQSRPLKGGGGKWPAGRHCEPVPAPADRRSGRPRARPLFRRQRHPPARPAAPAPHSGTRPSGNSRRPRADLRRAGETRTSAGASWAAR